MAINNVPQIWKDGHVSLGALWGLYSQHPHMPRLRDRKVLNEGVVDLPMIWVTDAFALATGYAEAAGRYRTSSAGSAGLPDDGHFQLCDWLTPPPANVLMGRGMPGDGRIAPPPSARTRARQGVIP